MASKADLITGPGPVPQDALDYFLHKGLRPAFDYRDVWREEHAFSFTVAKATELDVLTTIHTAVSQAISEGRTLAQFKRDLKPELEKLGWWGRQEMPDPLSGETKAVQLGSPRRLRTIYNANVRTAHAAGQWQRAERTKDDLPHLLRTLGPSRKHRDQHVAWHGTLLPIDDSWWDTHMPPNGWECKCRVRQVSRSEHSRLVDKGLPAADRKQIIDPETGLPTGQLEKRYQPVITKAPVIRRVEWQNKRTGEIELVPEGIDPGWDTNPGKARAQNLDKYLKGKLVGADPIMVKAAEKDLAAYQKLNPQEGP